MKYDVALLVIDVQNGMFQETEPCDGHGLLERISGLITKARACDTPVIFVQHNEGEGEPLETNSAGWNIHPIVAPVSGDTIIQKHTPDSFHETNLHAELATLGIRKVVLVGLQTDLCIDATCRRASELDYHVTVVKDCHSTWSQGNQSATQIIAHYNDRFKFSRTPLNRQLLNFARFKSTDPALSVRAFILNNVFAGSFSKNKEI